MDIVEPISTCKFNDVQFMTLQKNAAFYNSQF